MVPSLHGHPGSLWLGSLYPHHSSGPTVIVRRADLPLRFSWPRARAGRDRETAPQGFCAHPPEDVTCPSPIIRPLPGSSVLLLSEWSGVVCTGGLFLLSYVWGRVLLSCLPCGGALSGLEGPSFPFPFGFSPKFFLVSLLSVWEASGPGLHTPLALWGVSLPTTPLSGLRLTSRGPGSCSCLALHSQSSVAYPPPLLSPAFFPGLGLDSFLPPACLFPSASASHSAPVRPTLGCSSYTHLALCSHHL